MINKDVQKYTVQYTAGTCGTLLTWFVNQHRDFPGGNFSVAPEYDIAITSKSLQWNWISDDLEVASIPDRFQDWNDTVENLKFDLEKNNIRKFETICFKTFPHDIVNDIQDENILDTLLTILIDAGVYSWIYPVFYRSSRYQYENSRVANRKYQVIAERNKDPIWINNKNSGFESIFETQDLHTVKNTRMKNVIKKYGIQPLFLDMAALLGADDDEYDRLVRFLNTERLTNWHGVLMSSVKFWDMPYA